MINTQAVNSSGLTFALVLISHAIYTKTILVIAPGFL